MRELSATFAVETPARHTQILVFIFTYIALTVDGADMMFLSYSLQELKQEFGLTDFLAGTLGSFTLAGMAIGGVYGGWCCDRYGRVRTITWSVAFFSVGTACLGFTHSYWQFSIIRFVSSLALGSVYLSCFVLMSEYVSSKYRATIMGSMLTGYTFGFIVAALLSRAIIPVHGWHGLFFVAIIPIFICVILQIFIPEPPAWRALQARSEKQANEKSEDNKPKRNNLVILWQNRNIRKLFLLWTVAAFFLQFGYYGVSNWMPSYLEKELGMQFKSMTLYMIGTYLAMFLGKIIAGYMGDLFGRRIVYAGGAFVTAIFLYILLQFNTESNIIYLLTLFGFVYGLTIGTMSTYITETFPTEIRGLAAGASYNIARIGGAIAPAVIGIIASTGSIGIGFLTICVAYILTGLITLLFIPEGLHDPQKAG